VSKRSKVLFGVYFLVFAYIAVAGVRYAFAHPELTDTQRILNFVDVLLWR